MQCEIAVLEYEVLFRCVAISLDYVHPSVTFDLIKDVVQLPSSYHELFELDSETDLWVLTVYPQKVMLCQETSCFSTDMTSFQIVLDIEETGNDKLIVVHTLNRTDTFHTEVTV